MTLHQNTLRGLRIQHWSWEEAIAYFLRGIARELNIAPRFFLKCYLSAFKRRWLRKNGKESYFDFNGAKLPDISNDCEKIATLTWIFDEVFLIHCFYHDKYDKSVIDFVGQVAEPYNYNDIFDATVHSGDVVIDAGAWLGDFSAYAASKGAIAYAFEPVTETFELLKKTAELNDNKIYPVQKALSDKEGEMIISISKESIENSIILEKDYAGEKVILTTLDKFVEENNIEKVDFIKADIEGAERDMLKGASYVLKTFAPKLAICTYHLPDDREVLEKIIREANPNYKVIHLRHKLFAAVVK